MPVLGQILWMTSHVVACHFMSLFHTQVMSCKTQTWLQAHFYCPHLLQAAMGEKVEARSHLADGSSQWLDLGHMGSYGKVGQTAGDDQPRTWAILMHPDEAFTAAYVRVKPEIIDV